MDDLKSQILAYTPQTEREKSDKALILRCMEIFPDTLTRENQICHFTASNWIVNNRHTKALMLHHNIENIWMWSGGHADGESNLLQVALREANEETSLNSVRPITNQIFSLEVFAVPPHFRKGKFISAHIHLNCGFLLEADENEAFHIKPDENSAIRWMTFEEITNEVNKRKMSPHYIDLIARSQKLKS